MKNSTLAFVTTLGLIVVAITGSVAQQADGIGGIFTKELKKDTIARLKMLTGKNVEGKTYLHWDVARQHKDGVYIIFRSLDEKNYVMAGQKISTGVPVTVDIAYYFTDEFTYEKVASYRVLHISEDQTYIISDPIRVAVDKKTMLTATK